MRRRYRRRPAEPQHDLHPNDYPFGGQVVTTMVDNPNPIGPARIAVARNIRNDVLAGLVARHRIDEAQFMAGRCWEHCYETASIGTVIAMDPLKEPVDGGGSALGYRFTDAQLHAFEKLKQSRIALGLAGYSLLRAVLIDRMTMQEIGGDSSHDARIAGKAFQWLLEELAQLWGFANGTRQNKHAPDGRQAQRGLDRTKGGGMAVRARV